MRPLFWLIIAQSVSGNSRHLQCQPKQTHIKNKWWMCEDMGTPFDTWLWTIMAYIFVGSLIFMFLLVTGILDIVISIIIWIFILATIIGVWYVSFKMFDKIFKHYKLFNYKK
jgi:hypothetical protein